jgi:polar amino acid transport system substrate-binding protein
MNPWRLGLTVVLLLAGLTASAREVTVCADPDPPPWTYWVRDSANAKTTSYIGFSVDTFTTAFKRIGHSVRFIGDLPWARCLLMVQEGKVDFAMDAYHSDERAKLYEFSHHYNTLTPQVFFRTQKPITVTVIADLKKYKGCGMLGASYAHYGLKAEELDLGVNTYEGMLAKLKAGRCDYFVEELEVISGYKKLGRDLLGDPGLHHNAVVDASAPAKHLITAKGGEASKLLPKLNQNLTAMIRSGELAKIWGKHMPDAPFAP